MVARCLRAQHRDAPFGDPGGALGSARPGAAPDVDPDAKAGEREQPITPELAALLTREIEQRDDRKGWIFRSPHKDSGTGPRVRMERPFRDAAARAGLDSEVSCATTTITKLVEARVDLPTVQQISGHKTLAMVLRYAHVHGRHIDQAIRRWGEPFRNKLGTNRRARLHRNYTRRQNRRQLPALPQSRN